MSEMSHEVCEVETSLHQLQRAALEAAAHAMLIMDRSGQILWANHAFTVLSGYTAQEAIGRNPRELIHSGKVPAELYASMWRTILAGETWQGELVNRRKDGSHYLEALTISPVRGGDGEVGHFIAVKRDVTQERELAIRVHEAQRMESIGRLAGGVAHDFNNLLSVINGGLDMVLDDLEIDAPLRAELVDVRQASERAANLTQQLLAFGRQQVLRKVSFKLADVVREPLRLLGRLFGERIRFETRLTSDSEVRADRGQLEQVFVNLVANARDALPEGGVITVTTRDTVIEGRALFDLDGVRVSQAPSPGRYAVLSVTDNGTGMDAEVLSHLFEPFFTTKPVGTGTGLGLPTAYGIVHQSGGFIGVRSQSGVGSTFEVHLPIETRPDSEVRDGGAKTSILLVDDEDALRRLTARILTKAGYEVLAASGGHEALELAHRRVPDLIVTDVVMPQMSGGELIAELEARYPGIAVIYTSGFTTDAIVKHGVEADQVNFLAKPYASAALLELIQKVLAQR